MVWKDERLSAETFLKLLKNTLPSQWGGEFPLPSGAKEQTKFMSKILHQMVEQADMGCCCMYWDAHASAAGQGWKNATKEQGLEIEHLFDFTWFKTWVPYEQPAVIIEHENNGSKDAFLKDLWKILVGFAPLRVMIGYAGRSDLWKSYLDDMNNLSSKAQWSYPVGSEDLVLVGYWRMEPQHFRILRRQEAKGTFEDHGWLSEITLAT